MKLRLIIYLSVLANLAFAVALAVQPDLIPLPARDFFVRHFHIASSTSAPEVAAAARTSTPPPKLWSTLATTDLRTLVQRLLAAGFPPDIIRAIVRAQLAEHYTPLIRALAEPDPNTPYWKQPSRYMMSGDKRIAEINRLQQEQAKITRDLFSEMLAPLGEPTPAQRRQFGNLPLMKIEAVQRINDDYTEMDGALKAGFNGVMLKEDLDKQALLDQEKHADLAAVLSPDELAEYEMRTSPITNFLRNQMTAFDASKAEFTAIYQAEKDANDKLPGGVASDNQTRAPVQKEMEDALRAALGDARYTDYIRSMNNEYRQLTQIADRADLPAGTASTAFDVRDAAAAESNRIYDDKSMDIEQKRTALQALAQTTRDQLGAVLGPTAGPAYLNAAQGWLNNIASGAAVSFASSPPLLLVSGARSTIFNAGQSSRRLPPPPVAH